MSPPPPMQHLWLWRLRAGYAESTDTERAKSMSKVAWSRHLATELTQPRPLLLAISVYATTEEQFDRLQRQHLGDPFEKRFRCNKEIMACFGQNCYILPLACS